MRGVLSGIKLLWRKTHRYSQRNTDFNRCDDFKWKLPYLWWKENIFNLIRNYKYEERHHRLIWLAILNIKNDIINSFTCTSYYCYYWELHKRDLSTSCWPNTGSGHYRSAISYVKHDRHIFITVAALLYNLWQEQNKSPPQ